MWLAIIKERHYSAVLLVIEMNVIRSMLMSRVLNHCLKWLATLQRQLFYCYLKKDFVKRPLYYTKKLDRTRFAVLRATQKARSRMSAKMVDSIEQLAEIIYSIHQLRYRIDDYTIFKVCQRELIALNNTSIAALRASDRLTRSTYLDALLDAIHEFEGLYNRTLQVVANEPIVFLFFIQDWYALHELLSKMD